MSSGLTDVKFNASRSHAARSHAARSHAVYSDFVHHVGDGDSFLRTFVGFESLCPFRDGTEGIPHLLTRTHVKGEWTTVSVLGSLSVLGSVSLLSRVLSKLGLDRRCIAGTFRSMVALTCRVARDELWKSGKPRNFARRL